MSRMAQDAEYIARALELARAGIGLASPNPYVGAVVVSHAGQVIGEGTHTYEGKKHAEVIALEQAGEGARGATLYLNLEPCSHTGRTAPCADAVIAAGVKRVVASMVDPNPLVAGQGFARLQGAGVDVTVGTCEHEARKLNEAFAKFIRTRRPLVLLKTAMTLDGKIAPPPGESENPSALGAGGATRGWITSEVARAHVHELRHQADAILVGVGTIVADDPLLTDRSGRPRRRPLLRVILDSRLRLPLESRVVKTAQNDVIVFCAFADETKKRELESCGVRVEKIEFQGFSARPNLSEVLTFLGELEVTSLMIEGGAMINWAALTSGLVDKLFLYYAPKILGGSGAVPFASGIGFRRLADATTVRNIQLHRFGEDFAVEGYIHDPYA